MKLQLFLDKDVRPLQLWNYMINIFQWTSIEHPWFIQIMRPERFLHFQVFHWNKCISNFRRWWCGWLWNGKTLQKLDFLFFLWSITGSYVFISSDWWQHWHWIFPEGTFLRKYFWHWIFPGGTFLRKYFLSIFLTLNIPREDILRKALQSCCCWGTWCAGENISEKREMRGKQSAHILGHLGPVWVGKLGKEEEWMYFPEGCRNESQ